MPASSSSIFTHQLPIDRPLVVFAAYQLHWIGAALATFEVNSRRVAPPATPISGIGTPGLATPITTTVQATPTPNATVTALKQEIQQLKNQNAPDLFSNITILTVVITGLIIFLAAVIGGLFGFFRRLRVRRDEDRVRRDEDRFQAVVTDLGSTNIQARVGAAIMLRTFLQPGYERFYQQTFNLAAAYLRSRKPDLEVKDNPEAPVLASLYQALIVVFKEAFPLARDSISSEEKPFEPQSLDASRIRLDGVHLPQEDRVVVQEAFLDRADLRRAFLREANLSEADLSEANLEGAMLIKVDLRGADLGSTNVQQALTLEGTDLRPVKGLDKRHRHIYKDKRAIIDGDTTTSSSQSTGASSSSSQSNDEQVPSAPLAQGRVVGYDPVTGDTSSEPGSQL